MQIIWRNDSLCLRPDDSEERLTLSVLYRTLGADKSVGQPSRAKNSKSAQVILAIRLKDAQKAFCTIKRRSLLSICFISRSRNCSAVEGVNRTV